MRGYMLYCHVNVIAFHCKVYFMYALVGLEFFQNTRVTDQKQVWRLNSGLVYYLMQIV